MAPTAGQLSENSRRLARNTLLLYFRMFLLLLIGLFTSRVVLRTLGVDDYGVYNVVGGVVTVFTFLTTSLSAAVSRFLAVGLGRSLGMMLLGAVLGALGYGALNPIIQTLCIRTVEPERRGVARPACGG